MDLTPDTETFIRNQLDRAGIPGAALAWVTRSGDTGYLEHGFADLATRTPVQRDTRFHLFSGTKLYTAAALMRLVEQGLVELDAPIRRYLPELPVRDEITITNLASHASGLSDSLRAFLATHFPDEPAPSTATALARYALGRGKRPGVKASYGNVNFAILGELVSRASGVPYEVFVRRELLTPLGADLSFRDDGKGSAVGYVGRFSPMLLLLRFLAPDTAKHIRAGRVGGLVALRPYSLDTAAIGGLVGNTTAFRPLLREMLNPNDGVLRAESKRALLTVRVSGAAGIVSQAGVGIGWKRGLVEGRTFFNHEGGGAGFGTETRLYPDEGIGVVLLTNLSHSRGLSVMAHRVCERLRELA